MAKGAPRKVNESGSNFPKYRRWLKAKVIGMILFVGGLAVFLGNVESIGKLVRGWCVEVGFCSPGNHFINARLQLADPSSPDVDRLFPFDGFSLDHYVAPFNVEALKNSSDSLVEFRMRGGPNGWGTLDGMPYQIITPQMGYWDPFESAFGWKLGLPIVDLLLAEKGKPVDVTDFEIEVVRSIEDVKPYVQIVTTGRDVFRFLLVNESKYENVNINISFGINDVIYSCGELDRAVEFDRSDLLFELNEISLGDSKLVDLSAQLRLVLDDFDHREYRMMEKGIEQSAKLGSAPSGYHAWLSRKLDREALNLASYPETAAVYGFLEASADDEEYKTRFCADVPIDPPEGVGGGGIALDKGQIVKLRKTNAPYIETYDISNRLDEDDPHYRTAIMFFAEESGAYEIRLVAKSFGRKIYESDLMRLNIFIPKTTYQEMDLDIASMSAKPMH